MLIMMSFREFVIVMHTEIILKRYTKFKWDTIIKYASSQRRILTDLSVRNSFASRLWCSDFYFHFLNHVVGFFLCCWFAQEHIPPETCKIKKNIISLVILWKLHRFPLSVCIQFFFRHQKCTLAIFSWIWLH